MLVCVCVPGNMCVQDRKGTLMSLNHQHIPRQGWLHFGDDISAPQQGEPCPSAGSKLPTAC